MTFSCRVREPMRDVELGLWSGERRLLRRRERVLVPGEMVKWTVKREVFAQDGAPAPHRRGRAFLRLSFERRPLWPSICVSSVRWAAAPRSAG